MAAAVDLGQCAGSSHEQTCSMWQSKTLQPPATLHLTYQPEEATHVLQGCWTQLQKATVYLSKDPILTLLGSELYILSRLVYKANNTFRRHMFLRTLKKMENCLQRLKDLPLLSSLQNLQRDWPSPHAVSSRPEVLYVPSRQMLQFVLVRLQSTACLLHQTITYAVSTMQHVLDMLRLGHHIPQMLVYSAVVSRAWVLCRSLKKQVLSWYESLHLQAPHLKAATTPWLEGELPSDLAKFLGKEPGITEPRNTTHILDAVTSSGAGVNNMEDVGVAVSRVPAEHTDMLEDLGVAIQRMLSDPSTSGTIMDGTSQAMLGKKADALNDLNVTVPSMVKHPSTSTSIVDVTSHSISGDQTNTETLTEDLGVAIRRPVMDPSNDSDITVLTTHGVSGHQSESDGKAVVEYEQHDVTASLSKEPITHFINICPDSEIDAPQGVPLEAASEESLVFPSTDRTDTHPGLQQSAGGSTSLLGAVDKEECDRLGIKNVATDKKFHQTKGLVKYVELISQSSSVKDVVGVMKEMAGRVGPADKHSLHVCRQYILALKTPKLAKVKAAAYQLVMDMGVEPMVLDTLEHKPVAPKPVDKSNTTKQADNENQPKRSSWEFLDITQTVEEANGRPDLVPDVILLTDSDEDDSSPCEVPTPSIKTIPSETDFIQDITYVLSDSDEDSDIEIECHATDDIDEDCYVINEIEEECDVETITDTSSDETDCEIVSEIARPDCVVVSEVARPDCEVVSEVARPDCEVVSEVARPDTSMPEVISWWTADQEKDEEAATFQRILTGCLDTMSNSTKKEAQAAPAGCSSGHSLQSRLRNLTGCLDSMLERSSMQMVAQLAPAGCSNGGSLQSRLRRMNSANDQPVPDDRTSRRRELRRKKRQRRQLRKIEFQRLLAMGDLQTNQTKNQTKPKMGDLQTNQTNNQTKPSQANEGSGNNEEQRSQENQIQVLCRQQPPKRKKNTGYIVGLAAKPLPDNNIGSQLMQKWGWKPGSGLGRGGTGITAPIQAIVRHGRKGLGALVLDSTPQPQVAQESLPQMLSGGMKLNNKKINKKQTIINTQTTPSVPRNFPVMNNTRTVFDADGILSVVVPSHRPCFFTGVSFAS